MPAIKLKSQDGHVITVEIAVARSSATIRSLMDFFYDEFDEEKEIPFSNIRGKILVMVFTFVEHYIEVFSRKGKYVESEWDVKFRNMEPYELNDLTSAADYLEVRPLMRWLSGKLPFKGKDDPEIRALCGPMTGYNAFMF